MQRRHSCIVPDRNRHAQQLRLRGSGHLAARDVRADVTATALIVIGSLVDDGKLYAHGCADECKNQKGRLEVWTKTPQSSPVFLAAHGFLTSSNSLHLPSKGKHSTQRSMFPRIRQSRRGVKNAACQAVPRHLDRTALHRGSSERPLRPWLSLHWLPRGSRVDSGSRVVPPS